MENENVYSVDLEDLSILEEYKQKGKIALGFLPFITYDLVQTGYPIPNKGVMIPRPYGGTNEKGELLPSDGKWVKVEHAIEEINKLKSDLKTAVSFADDFQFKFWLTSPSEFHEQELEKVNKFKDFLNELVIKYGLINEMA